MARGAVHKGLIFHLEDISLLDMEKTNHSIREGRSKQAGEL